MKNLTIIIPVFNEERHIGQLLQTLSTMRPGNEVLVIDGGSSDHTIELVQRFIASLGMDAPRFSMLHNSAKFQAQALNIGLEAAQEATCLRLDGHLQIPHNCDIQNEIDSLSQAIEGNPQCSAAGFKQRFMGQGIIDSAIALLSATPYLSGFSRYRYALRPCTSYNTAWLFCVDRQLAIDAGGFDARTTPNEDQNFNRHLTKHTGKPILIYPSLPLYYQPRSTIQGLTLQYFNYGLARARSTFLTKSPMGSLLVLVASLAHFLIALLYAGALITTPIAYLGSLILIFSCNAIAISTDRLHALRNVSLPRPRPLVLVAALLLSPLLAAVPSLARSSGSLWHMVSSGRAANTPHHP